jgi:hypothetical protein
MRWIAMLCLMMPVPVWAQGGEALFSADGYRISHYRGPVPMAPEGVERITVEAVAALRGRALLIDVMPAEGAVRDADGVWHLAEARSGIPGEHWFPEAGRGVPAPILPRGLKRGSPG